MIIQPAWCVWSGSYSCCYALLLGPRNMVFTSTWCICLLPLLLYQEVSACFCPIDIFRRSREEWICNSYSYSNDVYEATVEAAYCKCQPNDTSTTVFSCIQYSDNGDGVAGSTEETYECTRPSYLLSMLASCSDVTARATGSDGKTAEAMGAYVCGIHMLTVVGSLLKSCMKTCRDFISDKKNQFVASITLVKTP